MNTNVKFAAIALAAALVGGSAGATLTSWKSEAATAQLQPAPVAVQPAPQVDTATTAPESQPVVDENATAAEPVDAAAAQPRNYVASARPGAPAAAPARSGSSGRSANSRQVYYDYGQPRASSAPSAYTYRQDRSFWDKHRDKLSTAIGAGSGALLGGLIGGKRGAGIGAIAGGAGTALWTYKLRKRNNY